MMTTAVMIYTTLYMCIVMSEEMANHASLALSFILLYIFTMSPVKPL